MTTSIRLKNRSILQRMSMTLALICALIFGRSAPAFAQSTTAEHTHTHAARDMVTTAPDGSALVAPPLPASYRRVNRGPLHLAYAPEIESAVQLTLNHVLQDATSLSEQLGLARVPELEIRLVPTEQDLRTLAPLNAPPPQYAVGVAYPSIRLTLVSLREPQTAALADMRRVLRHELSHLLLAIATNDAPIPRWFSEGLAVTQAAEHSFERFEQLMLASWSKTLIPLAQLNDGFSSSADDVSLAYAESADFVSHLLQRDGLARLAVFCDHLRHGVEFAEGIKQTWGNTLQGAELTWKDDLKNRHMLLPFVAGTGLMWGASALLLFIGWWRAKLRSKRKLKRWEVQEQMQAQQLAQEQLRMAELYNSHKMMN